MLRSSALACALVVAGLSMSASGAIIETGVYQLSNHPDGSANPPLYGLRLDELFNATSGHDIFTFDFDHASSNMRMNYTGAEIHIYGVVWGGRDTGSAHANDQYLGLYTVDMRYELGVRNANADDDIVVDTANRSNNGFIIAPNTNDKIPLVDERMGGYSFRFGDEDNNQGHRGHPGLSGWGWLTHNPATNPHVAASDFLFTATLIPTPGAIALAGLALFTAGRRRRN